MSLQYIHIHIILAFRIINVLIKERPYIFRDYGVEYRRHQSTPYTTTTIILGTSTPQRFSNTSKQIILYDLNHKHQSFPSLQPHYRRSHFVPLSSIIG